MAFIGKVFFTINGSYTLGYIATNKDSKGHDLGTKFKLTDIAGSAGKYKLTVTLIHQPKKPNNGLTDTGGSTDIEATFDIELVD